MKTQGTELYVIDPEGGAVLDVGCVTSINGVNVTNSANEVTCLRDLVRRYEAGLGEPGQATFGIYTDPQDATHVRLHELYTLAENMRWTIGWSDATGTLPGATALDSNGDYDFTALPTSRTWLTFLGFMTDYPFAFEQNTQVASTINIQVSGAPVWVVAVS